MKVKILAIFALLLISLAACGPQKSSALMFTGSSQAWIDAPLPGSHQPLEVVEIVAHAASPDGISFFVITLNGQFLSNVLPDTSSLEPQLMYMRYYWQPAVPGKYLIEVKAFDKNNQLGSPAQSLVVVEALTPTPVNSPTPTSSPTLANTPQPTPTYTVTPSPTFTPTHTPLPGPAPIVFTNNRVNVSKVYVGRDSCGRKEVDIYITIPAASKVSQVSISYQLVDNTNASHVSSWVTEQMSQVSPGGIEWIISVSPEGDIPGGLGFVNAELHYQFTATNSLGSKTSGLYSNVQVEYCRR